MFTTVLKNTMLITGIAFFAVIVIIYILIIYIFVNASYSSGGNYVETLRRFGKYILHHLVEILVFLGILIAASYLISQALG
jgi:mannose/fructose/N-acetylgalactosamine-specific phosphotransferase system component IID